MELIEKDKKSIEILPNVLLFYIFQYLNLRDLSSISSVNKRWNSIFKRDELWKQRLKNSDYNIPHLMMIGSTDTNQIEKGDYQSYYKNIYCVEGDSDTLESQDIYFYITHANNTEDQYGIK